MAEFSAGLQTQQEERYVISSGGRFYEFFMTVAPAIPHLTVKKGPLSLFGHVR